MSARHDWRINPQERSLEPVETGEDFAAERLAEEGYAEPQAEASGEQIDTDEPRARQTAHSYQRVRAIQERFGYVDENDADFDAQILADEIDRLNALFASRPAPTAEKALGEALGVARTVMKDAQDDLRSPLGANSAIWHRLDNALRLADTALKDSQP